MPEEMKMKMIKMIENKSWRGYGTARISYVASDCENQHSHFGKKMFGNI